jgi:nitrite reductase/ring-hydroxylating ferredoxin subunit
MNKPVPARKIGRFPGMSYQDFLAEDTRETPAFMRELPVPDLGVAPIRADRYFDPGFFKKEVEHVWGKTWQMACRAEEIPNAGDYMIYEIVDKSLILSRQNDGAVRAYYNSCPHRGRKLAMAPGCKNEFKCPFHGLTWNKEGQIVHNPFDWDFPQWGKGQPTLPEAKVGVWGGWVFINMDPNCASLEELMAPMQEFIDRWDPENTSIIMHIEKVVRANWKTTAEAFMESHHSWATHPQITPYLADINSQYDVMSEAVSRAYSAQNVASPLCAKPFTDAEIVAQRIGGDQNTRIAAGAASLPEGTTARAFIAEMTRRMCGAEDGIDYNDKSDAEMSDAILYNVCPNLSGWGGFAPNLTYRWRPNGSDPDSAIMDIYLMKRVPKGKPRPAPARAFRVEADTSIETIAEKANVMLGLAAVFDQDMLNLPHVQTGLKASGTNEVALGRYQESRIRLLHQWIDQCIAKGEGQGAA